MGFTFIPGDDDDPQGEYKRSRKIKFIPKKGERATEEDKADGSPKKKTSNNIPLLLRGGQFQEEQPPSQREDKFETIISRSPRKTSNNQVKIKKKNKNPYVQDFSSNDESTLDEMAQLVKYLAGATGISDDEEDDARGRSLGRREQGLGKMVRSLSREAEERATKSRRQSNSKYAERDDSEDDLNWGDGGANDRGNKAQQSNFSKGEVEEAIGSLDDNMHAGGEEEDRGRSSRGQSSKASSSPVERRSPRGAEGKSKKSRRQSKKSSSEAAESDDDSGVEWYEEEEEVPARKKKSLSSTKNGNDLLSPSRKKPKKKKKKTEAEPPISDFDWDEDGDLPPEQAKLFAALCEAFDLM